MQSRQATQARAEVPATLAALAFAHASRQRFVSELMAFLRFASVSALPAQAGELRRCAGWLAAHLRALGLEHVRVLEGSGHPAVVADWLHRPGAPTLLVYGHYDVQPADPASAWTTPPFAPALRDGYVYARGAADDKGQMFIHVKAIESWLRTAGTLPLNVRCLFDGEEETGSAGLPGLLARHPALAQADVAVLSDTWMPAPDRPAIVESLRGALGIELEVIGQRRDLHAGNFGGTLRNPLHALTAVLCRLHDTHGCIAIPGFYDRVRMLAPAERAYMARHGPTDAQVLADAGAAEGWGEPGYSLYERTAVRPALEITTLAGGYAGPGARSVIPSRALARLDFRLVPHQEPAEIARLVCRHIGQAMTGGVRLRMRTLMQAAPATMARNHPVVDAAMAACQAAFGNRPVFLRLGGTIPVVDLLRRRGMPVLALGFALPDDAMHAPDERFLLASYGRGIEAGVRLLPLLARMVPAAAASAASATTGGPA